MLCAALPPDALIPALASLGEPLSAQLADLRSAIVRAACDTLRELATVYGPALALGSMPLIVAVLPQLDNLVVETSVGWWLRRYNVTRDEGAELYASLLEQVVY